MTQGYNYVMIYWSLLKFFRKLMQLCKPIHAAYKLQNAVLSPMNLYKSQQKLCDMKTLRLTNDL